MKLKHSREPIKSYELGALQTYLDYIYRLGTRAAEATALYHQFDCKLDCVIARRI